MTKLKTALFLSTIFFFSASTQVQAGYLTLSRSEIQKVIGDYPQKGSAEEAQDDATLLDYQDTRSQAQCEAAAAQSNATIRKFFGKVLSESEIRFLNVYFLRVRAIAGANVAIAKGFYHRPRPYNRNHLIKPCIDLESSSSYPSGHTTESRLLARVLSLRYPSRKAAFLKAADQAATNRVLGGVHHPSDIEAGKKLGDYLASKYYK